MAVKLFLDNILLLEVYIFEGFSNQHKNYGMANNYLNSFIASSDFKNPQCVAEKIVGNIVFDFNHSYWLTY